MWIRVNNALYNTNHFAYIRWDQEDGYLELWEAGEGVSSPYKIRGEEGKKVLDFLQRQAKFSV